MDDLSVRQESLAATDPKVLWVDGRIQITGDNLDHFDTDLIHPSVLGSRIIGEQIAAAIQTFEE